MANYQNIRLSKYIPSGRVSTLDMVRGIAILFMTVYHQGLIYPLKDEAYASSFFVGYLAAPFFLAVSGGSLFFHEKRHHWPFKMIIHGAVLYLFAWLLDIIVHRSFRIDWDIFQLIGRLHFIWPV